MPNEFEGYTEITDPALINEMLATPEPSVAEDVTEEEVVDPFDPQTAIALGLAQKDEEEDVISTKLAELGYSEATDPVTLSEVEKTISDPMGAALAAQGFSEVADPFLLQEVNKSERNSRLAQARGDILKGVEAQGLGASFKNAMSKNFSLKRNKDGKWEFPVVAATSGKDAGFIDRTLDAAALLVADVAGTFGDSSDRLSAMQDKIQEQYGLSDEDMVDVRKDIKKAYNSWGKNEDFRMLSNEQILVNPENPILLDTEKLTKALKDNYGSIGRQEEFLASLPQRQVNLAGNLLEAYEAAAAVARKMESPVSVGLNGTLLSPSEYAAQIGEKNAGSPEFIKRYESEVLDKQGDVGKFVRGLTVDSVLGWNKVATTVLGLGGFLGSDTLGELGAEGSAAAGVIGRGKADTGLTGALVQEAPSIVTQIVLGALTGGAANAALGTGAAAQAVTTASTLLTAGAQSAGMTYADEIASGATPEEARKNALMAGTSTALITGIFNKLGAGGVESVAAGKKVSEVTVRDLFRAASKQELWENTRGFAKDLLKSYVGEASEEGIDQLVSKFLTADADTDLSTAWTEAWEAFKVGGFMGGVTNVAQGALGGGRDPLAGDMIDGQTGLPIAPEGVAEPENVVDKAVAELLPPVTEESDVPASVAAARDTVPASILTPEEREAQMAETEVVAPEVVAPEVVADETVTPTQQTTASVSPEQLKAEFNLTDEQAATASEFAKAMGIPAERLLVGSGLTPAKQAEVSSKLAEPEAELSGVPEAVASAKANGVTVAAEETPSGIQLFGISTDPSVRRQGKATEAIDRLKTVASEKGLPISLTVEASEEMSKVELENWYSKQGFEMQPDGETMVFTPAKPSPQKTEVPTGSLPEGQTPTSGDVGVSAAPQATPQISPPDTSSVTQREGQSETSVRPSASFTPPTTVTPTGKKAPKGQPLVTPSVISAFKNYTRRAGRNPSRTRQEAAFSYTADKLAGDNNLQARRDMMQFFTGVRPRVDSTVPVKQLKDTFAAWLDNGAQTLPVKPREASVMKKDPKAVADFKASQLAKGIRGFGGILSKSAAIKLGKYEANKSEWNDAPEIKNPVYVGLVYDDTGELPSTIASLIFNSPRYEGALAGPNANDLWEALGAELSGRNDRLTQQEAREDERLAQAEAFTVASEVESDNLVAMSELEVGDRIVMDGETLEVTSRSVDEDGYVERTVLKGGAKFGTQIVSGDITLPVESVEIGERMEDTGFAPEDTVELETQTEESITAEKTARETRDKIAEKQARPLTGSAGDLTADMFGEGETPLFNERRDQTSPKSDVDSPAALGLDLQPYERPTRPAETASDRDKAEYVALDAFERSAKSRGVQSLQFFTLGKGKDADNRRDDAGRVPRTSVTAAIRAFEKAFGKTVVFYSADGAPASGLVYPTTPNFIGIDANSAFSLPYLLGHELGHSIKRQDRNLYDAVQRDVLGLVRNREEYAAMLFDRGYDQSKTDDELFNDIVGNLFARDSQMWRDLAEVSEPSVFTRLAKMANTIIDKMLGGIRGLNARDTTKQTADELVAIRENIVKMLREYEARGNAAREIVTDEMATPEESPMFEADTREQRPAKAQRAKGTTIRERDGTIRITGNKEKADFSTAIHELTHAFEFSGFPTLTDSQVAELKSWAGDDTQGRQAMKVKGSEKLARGFENYVASGRAPLPSLQVIFDKMAKWMLDIYGKIQGTDIDVEIPENIRAIFDSIASRIDPLVFTTMQERVDNPTAVESDAGVILATDDGTPLPPAIAPTPENIEMIGEVNLDQAIETSIAIVKGALEAPIPPAPTYPEINDDWNPDNLYSLQERRALEEAEKYGYEADWKQAQRTFKENFSRAYAAEEQWVRDGTAGTALIERIEREGADAVLSDQDIAHLTIEGFKRKIELDKAIKGLTDALGTDSKEQLEAAELRHNAANQDYQQVLNLAARARTASGRSLNAWKQAIREDFSPATLYTRQLANLNSNRMKNGEPPVRELPADEVKKIIAYSERMLEMEAALRDAQTAEALPADERQAYEDRLAEQDALIEELLAEKTAARKGRSIQDATKRALTDRIKQAAAEARERLKAAGEPVTRYQLEADETPEEKARWFDKVLVIAEPYIVDTAMSSARFADLVRTRLGQSMVAVAEKLRIDVDRYIRVTEADITGREIPSVEKLQGELNPDIPVTREMVYELAKAHIFEGARKSEVMDRVTATLQTMYPDITRDEVSQLFTDYGRQTALKPDELAKALRTAKSIELVQKQIDDLTKRKTMMKTGRAKDDADIALRELRKKRDDLAKSIGYNPTNPAAQLASAQTAAKRRMENEIAELTQAIDSGNPRVRVRRGVEYTEDMKVLRDRLTDLRASYDTIFGRERTDAERNAMLIKDLDRRIAKEEDLISRGLLAEPTVNQPAFSESPEVLARREKLAELRQQNRDLHAPEIALKKALDAANKAVQRRLDTVVRRGAALPKKPSTEPTISNADLDLLWKAADAMDDYIKELRRNLPLTPEQEARAMQDAYDRAVQAREDLKARIQRGELEIQKPARKIPLEERTRLVRLENAELQKQITQMQKDAKLGQFSDEAKEARRVGGLQARIAELRRKRIAQDFTKKPRREPISNERIRDLELTISAERNAYDNERAQFVYNDMTTWQKWKASGVAFLRSIQAFNLSGDLGVVFRTLGPAMGTIIGNDLKNAAKRFWNRQAPENVTKPSTVARMAREGWKALTDERNQIAVYEEIFKHPDYPKMKSRGFKLLSPHETTFELNPDDSVRINPVKLVTSKMIIALTFLKAGIYVAAMSSPIGLATGGALLVAKPSLVLSEVGKIIAAGLALAGTNRFRIAIERANNTMVNVARWELARATMEAYPDMANDEKFMDDMMRTTMLFSGQFTGTGERAKKIEQNTAFLGRYIAYINHNVSKAAVAFGVPLFRIGLAKRDRRALGQAAKMYRNDLILTASRMAILATVVGAIFGDDEEDEETVQGLVVDPRSPHFLSVKLGSNTFVDVTASRTKWWKQALNLVNSEGLEKDALRDGFVVPAEKTAMDKAEGFERFVAGLLAPNKKTFLEFVIKRRSREGGDLSKMNIANNLDVLADQIAMNLTLKDLKNIYEEHGAVKGSILAQYLYFGDSVQIRETNAEREERIAVDKERETIPPWWGEDN